MKNMKFRVNSPEHSEEIQRELFRLGYFWEHKDMQLWGIDKHFLFTSKKGFITWHEYEIYFQKKDHTETTLEELKAM